MFLIFITYYLAFIFYFPCVVTVFLHALLVISPELVMEVEARMKRNYMPPMMPQRKHSRHAAKPHLPTVQELQVQGKYSKSILRQMLFNL